MPQASAKSRPRALGRFEHLVKPAVHPLPLGEGVTHADLCGGEEAHEHERTDQHVGQEGYPMAGSNVGRESG